MEAVLENLPQLTNCKCPSDTDRVDQGLNGCRCRCAKHVLHDILPADDLGADMGQDLYNRISTRSFEGGYSNKPAEYVFNPLNEPNSPTPAKNALIIGTGMPPTSSCKLQP